MKKLLSLAIVLIALFVFTAASFASDMLINSKVNTVSHKISKTGNPYTVFTFTENKELSGVKYSTETAVFCFSDIAKNLKQGQDVKFVMKRSIRDGNESNVLISLLK